MKLIFITFFFCSKIMIFLAQLPPPPPDKPDCSAGWQTIEMSYIPTLASCGDMEQDGGVPCQPNMITSCTGRNPLCAQMEDKSSFKCCSDIPQDSSDIETLQADQIKPLCPNGAIPFKMPQVMLCDPSIVNICPYDYTCVEAENGHLLPSDSRSLCCKTSTLYSFGKVFIEAGLTPKIVPNAPLSGIQYVKFDINILVLIDYPNSLLENMQFYYDRVCDGGKEINLEEPIPDGGFINKRVINGSPQLSPEQQSKSNYRKMWVVLVYKTVDPLTRMYISISTDLHAKYQNVVQFLRSPTAQRLGTPIAGSYFYLTTD
uniref:Uncharacterized protein n=1 Tax=Panagrolaimus superbus TaxID=310955 RepID=A0A914Z503_9BILA